MLKNKVREQIRTILNIDKPNFFKPQKKIEKLSREEENDENIRNNNSAIIEIPNYLEIPVFKNSKTLLICLFQIVTEGLSPFLLYLLNHDMQMITMPSFDGGKNNTRLAKETVLYMKGQLKDFGDISYAGFTETDTNNIVFLKYISPNNNEQPLLPADYYWATVHELVNLKSVMSKPIALTVTQFFINNPDLCQLKNEDDMVYESPVVGYYFGTNDIYRENRIEKYGKCYYFDIIYSTNSIMRAALFLKRTGLLNDNFDNCDSLVYNNKDKHYYLIKAYAQHTVLT